MNVTSDAPVRVEIPLDDGGCIVCGPRNPIGLGLRFRRHDDGVRADATLPIHFGGWSGIVHGGVISMLLDEAMGYAAIADGRVAVTAELTMRFRAAIPVATPVVITGRVARSRGRALWTEARVSALDGRELASGTGTLMVRRDVLPSDGFGALDG